ncbi:hypothetical protein [Clostridium butyricum]|nr:hypothetical protein [Clostridium butyricum]
MFSDTCKTKEGKTRVTCKDGPVFDAMLNC